MKPRLAVAFVALSIAGSHAPAELVYFKRGGQAQLPATIEGEVVRLDTPDGPRIFPRDDFLAIRPGHRPLEEWATRRDSARKDGRVEARFAAAWWALENGLTDEAMASLGDLRSDAANHGPTRRALAGLDALALPCPDPDLEPVRGRLRPLRFVEARSPHVVLLHQHGEADAGERLGVLERVVQTFLVSFAAQGIELPPPRHRLISVYFAGRRDYARFLRLVDAEAFVDTQGYYHPILHAVFAFDARSTDEQSAGHRAIRNRENDGAAPSELDRQMLLLDLDRRATDLGIGAHETVHQLTTETGLAPRFDDFPTWLHEGLAAQFEVVRGGRWAGFGRLNDRRLPDWRSIRPAPRLAPLLRDSGLDHGYSRDRYAESWALVYFLRKDHPREFLAYLDLLRTPTPGRSVRPDRAAEAFRSAFGKDLDGLESSWRDFVAGLETPLELGRPEMTGRVGGQGPPGSKRRLVGADPAH